MNSSRGVAWRVISSWISLGSRVLDLGCGGGEMLADLAARRGVSGYGVEIDEKMVAACIERKVSVIQADIESGLDIFASHSFDSVVLSQTLQEIADPAAILREMLRVGRRAIVSFDNAGQWRNRLTYLFGKVPQPVDARIRRLVTTDDFDRLCRSMGLVIARRSGQTEQQAKVSFLFGLRAEVAVYELQMPR